MSIFLLRRIKKRINSNKYNLDATPVTMYMGDPICPSYPEFYNRKFYTGDGPFTTPPNFIE